MKLDHNYNGKTRLRAWWKQVKANFQAIESHAAETDTAIEEERTERQNVDAALERKINAETTSRTTADNALDGKISAEMTARSNADAELDGKITSEKNDRINADSSLQNQIGVLPKLSTKNKTDLVLAINSGRQECLDAAVKSVDDFAALMGEITKGMAGCAVFPWSTADMEMTSDSGFFDIHDTKTNGFRIEENIWYLYKHSGDIPLNELQYINKNGEIWGFEMRDKDNKEHCGLRGGRVYALKFHVVGANNDNPDIKYGDCCAMELTVHDFEDVISLIDKVNDNAVQFDKKIGNLTNLTTWSKENLVEAVNEVNRYAADKNEAAETRAAQEAVLEALAGDMRVIRVSELSSECGDAHKPSLPDGISAGDEFVCVNDTDADVQEFYEHDTYTNIMSERIPAKELRLCRIEKLAMRDPYDNTVGLDGKIEVSKIGLADKNDVIRLRSELYGEAAEQTVLLEFVLRREMFPARITGLTNPREAKIDVFAGIDDVILDIDDFGIFNNTVSSAVEEWEIDSSFTFRDGPDYQFMILCFDVNQKKIWIENAASTDYPSGFWYGGGVFKFEIGSVEKPEFMGGSVDVSYLFIGGNQDGSIERVARAFKFKDVRGAWLLDAGDNFLDAVNRNSADMSEKIAAERKERTNADNGLQNQIGVLTNLTTENKTSLVAAVNETCGELLKKTDAELTERSNADAAIERKIGQLEDLDTGVTTNLVAAINDTVDCFYNWYDEADSSRALTLTEVNDAIEGKVDKAVGKGLSANDYTTAEKNKLAGIEENANNYAHPSSHPAAMIEESAERRFMTPAEKTKLAGIAAEANKYTHPAFHPASMITTDSAHRFVTDDEKTAWNTFCAQNPDNDALTSMINRINALEKAMRYIGDGTEFKPYLIETAADLEKIRLDLGAYYRLTNNIELSGTFEPIGSEDTPFTGVLDGGGYIIKNLKIDSGKTVMVNGEAVEAAGLFAVVGESGVVKELSFNTGTMVGAGAANSYAGIIAGVNRGTFYKVNAATTSATVVSEGYAGGLAGYNEGKIQYSYSRAKVTSNSATASGIAAVNAEGGLIEECFAVVTLTAPDDSKKAGLTYTNDGEIKRSHAVVQLTVDGSGTTDATTTQVPLSQMRGPDSVTTTYADWAFGDIWVAPVTNTQFLAHVKPNEWEGNA